MQFKLHLHSVGPIQLPVSYHAQVQALVYDILRKGNPDYAAFLHDKGYAAGGHSYKLFTYSLLQGAYYIIRKNRDETGRPQDPQIVFKDNILLEVRSPQKEFCDAMTTALKNCQQYELYNNTLTLTGYERSEVRILASDITIEMLSPLCVHKNGSAGTTAKCDYLTPVSEDLSQRLTDNLRHSLQAAGSGTIHDNITLVPLYADINEDMSRILPRNQDKYVTKFKDIYITAWRGRYRLTGHPEDLTFAYDVGLGDRNPTGFGLFRVLGHTLTRGNIPHEQA